MSMHTPGPWKGFDNPDDELFKKGVVSVVVDERKDIVSFVFSNKHGKPDLDEAMANAALIEAAPDLLAACRMAHKFIDDNYEQIVNSTLDGLKIVDSLCSNLAAARRKARGMT